MGEKYREIFRLEQMLLSENIPYKLRPIFDGWQIEYPAGNGERVCSAVQHQFSYGSINDRIEIMGLTDNDEQVQGFLTAEDVFNRISAHYKSCVLKQ